MSWMKSFFAVKPKKKATATLTQLRTALDKASARSIAVVTERWLATHPAFKPNLGKAQSMNGGCGALWMNIHGHSAAYDVPAFNDRSVWFRATSTGGKQHTGKALETLTENLWGEVLRSRAKSYFSVTASVAMIIGTKPQLGHMTAAASTTRFSQPMAHRN